MAGQCFSSISPCSAQRANGSARGETAGPLGLQPHGGGPSEPGLRPSLRQLLGLWPAVWREANPARITDVAATWVCHPRSGMHRSRSTRTLTRVIRAELANLRAAVSFSPGPSLALRASGQGGDSMQDLGNCVCCPWNCHDLEARSASEGPGREHAAAGGCARAWSPSRAIGHLLIFAWKTTRPVNLFALCSGLPLVGLGSFAVQTTIIEKSSLKTEPPTW